MLSFIALLSLLVIVLSIVDASPLRSDDVNHTLSFSARMNATRVTNIAAADKARAQAMKQAGHIIKRYGSSSFSINNSIVAYTAQVGVGSPATEYTLLIDTGSSNTWIKPNSYVPTSSSRDTGGHVSVSYGSGGFEGEEYLDTVTLSSDLVITDQSIGVANSTWGFVDVDGILGVGPTDLTYNTVPSVYDSGIPTVTDNLKSQGIIDTEALGIYFVPPSTYDSTGELTFGGYDSSKLTGGMNYVPLTTTPPASAYWGINQSITYGSSAIPILYETSGIVDTGTSLILIATDAFKRYQSATSATLDGSTGLLTISNDQYENLQALTFNIGDYPYTLTPNAQIWPRTLNANIGGNSDTIYLVISDIGSYSGSGLDFINGYAFLQRFYSVFDTTNSQIGFANTINTYATPN